MPRMSIPAADYAATTQYIFYDRDDARIKYLSAYVAPGTQVEYWDITHVLTDENRITPHPVADEFTATLVASQAMDRHRNPGDWLDRAVWDQWQGMWTHSASGCPWRSLLPLQTGWTLRWLTV